MSHPSVSPEAAPAPVFELHFSPRALVRSRLVTLDGEILETGQKGREVRWQQGAIAVCILVVYTRLGVSEGAPEVPLLEGERGSPARSLDNVLTKPGDWALNMFGEHNHLPRIRDFIYRKRAVSKSNPVSAVQWDPEHLDPSAIRLWREGQALQTPEEFKALLRVLLEEFNPRRVEKEWARLFPQPESNPPAVTGAPFAPTEGEVAGPPPADSEPSTRPWFLLLLLFTFIGVGAYFLGRATGPMKTPPPASPGTSASTEATAANESASSSAAVVERFIELLNARAYDEAYALTTPAFQEAVTRPAFALALGHQRLNFPRIAGNPYRNGADQLVHEYRVTLYVETEVRRVPALEGLALMPVTEIEAYAAGIQQLTAELAAAGVEDVFLRQLRKERLERPDASRYLQIVCGLDDATLAALYPQTASVTLDLTYFFELVRDPAVENGWRIQTVSDAADRLVSF